MHGKETFRDLKACHKRDTITLLDSKRSALLGTIQVLFRNVQWTRIVSMFLLEFWKPQSYLFIVNDPVSVRKKEEREGGR